MEKSSARSYTGVCRVSISLGELKIPPSERARKPFHKPPQTTGSHAAAAPRHLLPQAIFSTDGRNAAVSSRPPNHPEEPRSTRRKPPQAAASRHNLPQANHNEKSRDAATNTAATCHNHPTTCPNQPPSTVERTRQERGPAFRYRNPTGTRAEGFSTVTLRQLPGGRRYPG